MSCPGQLKKQKQIDFFVKISFVCFLLLPSMASSLSTDSLAHPTKIMCCPVYLVSELTSFFSLVLVDEDFAIFSVFAENGCKSRCFFFNF